ncbi:hypothetical protein KRP22_014905 [Phytophthora ramorum]|uniref:uncharacterized protein n=1 Tax=Phytophthora ramorum TaxID=164328 RepID=UPI0030B2F755|nr:hypothetical protein KRP23_11878 [Phytophthora ramorum]KAH7496146.1 hypothetical protein KRP22_14040 [Phytophthora ramorum]
MQAVRWNRLEVVKTLVASATPGSLTIESTTGNHFLDFLEAGVECAVSRGLEDMVIYLVEQWQGIKENGRESTTPSAFAFQFAPAFQVACIRRLPRLMEFMIERGGEHIVDYHWNEGSALAYAFAFGHTDIVDLLLRNGADPSNPTDTYSVASVRKWVEFGSPKDVRVSWESQIAADEGKSKRPAFIGPLDTYERSTSRLPRDDLCQIFAGSVSSSCSSALGNSSDATGDGRLQAVCQDLSASLKPGTIDEDKVGGRSQNNELGSPDRPTAEESAASELLANGIAALKVESENDTPQEETPCYLSELNNESKGDE